MRGQWGGLLHSAAFRGYLLSCILVLTNCHKFVISAALRPLGSASCTVRPSVIELAEGLVEGCGVNPLELRPVLCLPGLGPVGQRPLPVQLKHEDAPALLVSR